ncbi:Brix-domain-containing protein [Meredithblackwellia eburnea MCA 4105]
MLRRQTRLRREFLYSKSLEQKERQIWERKQRVKDLLAKGKAVPNGQGVGEREARMDDGQAAPMTHIDDEYSQAGIEDPRVLITTSRDPSSKLAQFAKEMRLCIPNSTRINRGNYVMKELADACRANGITDLIVLHEHRGVPDALMLSHFPHGPTVLFTLTGVVLRHSLDGVQGATVSEQYPHLIFDGFGSKLGSRVMNTLKFIFPVPKEDSKRTMTFVNEGDFISFRHHVFVKTSHKEVQLAEVGPRFEMRPYEIKQGTIEQTEADVEWALRPYQRTARKRNQL